MMDSPSTLHDLGDDHALERVPDGDRHTWLDISWSTVGIVTTLIQLFIGALVTFVGGMVIGLTAGFLVMLVGAALGAALGHIACRTGLSSTMIARRHGFGDKGAVITSSILAFMMIGLIAAENVLLYKGFLFFFGASDTLLNQVVAYGVMTLAWIGLTAYGFDLVTRVASVTLIGFLAVLAYMMVRIVDASGQSWVGVLTFQSQLPPEQLALLGAETAGGKLAFCVNLLIGTAGALALVDADLGRYARSSRDIGVAALLGNLFMDVGMVAFGGIAMYAGMPSLIEYYVNVEGMSADAAGRIALENPDRVAAAFIIFGGVVGTVLMVLAQSKAQVLNTYSSSLALTNLADSVFAWRPGRLLFVVLANLFSLVFLSGDMLVWFNSFLTILGVLTTCFTGIMIADYFVVAPALARRGRTPRQEAVNWAGVLSLCAGFVLAHYVLRDAVPIEFFTSLGVSATLYPLLRLSVLQPRPALAPAPAA